MLEMRKVLLGFAVLSVVLWTVGDAQAESKRRSSCTADSLPAIPDVRITSVTEEAAPVPHCKVAGVIGTEINFELLLPDQWNGKFVMGGGGGFVGRIVNIALLYGPLQSGYATVGTDTGHRGHGLDASWALNNLERVVNFGHAAVHRTTVTSKALIAGYYGKESSRDLFVGCSRGGGQALMEAQRYPEDFDGIVAGSPAYNWTHELGAWNTALNQIMYPDPNDLSRAIIGPEQSQLVGNAVMAKCDALDGLKDGIINNPLKCDFDVSTLACADGQTNACLTQQQVAAAKRIYDDLYIDGERIFPGYPVGGELSPGGWSLWLTGGLAFAADVENFQEGANDGDEYPAPVAPSAHFAFGNGVMKYLVYHDPEWNYADYTFQTFKSDVAYIVPTLNATSPDLSAFRGRGGKLLIWNGWGDMAITAKGTIEYYESVLEHDANAAEDVRLFLLPGMDHCSGGAGPSYFNMITEIDRWVETGEAPEQLTAFWLNEQNQPDGSRPVCAFPQYLIYKGTGDARDPSSFACVSDD
jgi:feruloyl esterase